MSDSGVWAVYLVIALSGLTALASEVVWTRMLSLLFGATVYTFALILAVFLLGLGIGSSIGSALARQIEAPSRSRSAGVKWRVCLSMAWAAYVLAKSLPYWPIDVTLVNNPWLMFQLDMVRCLWTVLPAAIFWGASFPLALAAVASKRQDAGQLVGGVYAANTVGAIVGSIGASLLLVAWIGTQNTERVLIAFSAVSALMMFALPARGAENGRRRGFAVIALFLAFGGGLLVWSVPRLPADLVAYGRFTPTRSKEGAVIEYVGEGITASVAVSRLPSGVLCYHNAGKTQASSEPADMRLQRMLGHLTTLVPSNPRKFLVIGFGAGATAGAVSIEPKLENETIVEIEPLVPKVVSMFFAEHNFNVAANPKVRIIIDDGRHFLMTTKEKFDGITSDPLDPWVKGAAALYTKEFFELAKSHLNPGGVVTQFVQLYESNEEAVKSEIGTFFEVFPHGSVWVNNVYGQGYDLVMLGQAEPTRINVDELFDRVNSPEYEAVAESLREVNFFSPLNLLATFAGTATDLKPWLENAPINRDHNMRLQYLAGMGLNLYRANDIYRNMVAFGPRMPKDMFTGSDSLLETLANSIQSGQFR